ncbi:phosphomethylpyrimidine synthase ThiC [bacterium]|nr:phosphomethylpyrimidine synthase ThiC [bacterium]
MTLLEAAKKHIITNDIKIVAKKEGIDTNKLVQRIAAGEIVIPKSKKHKFSPIGIGSGLMVKINANIGTSPKDADIKKELKKLRVAIKSGADAVMDLSTGGDLNKIRRTIIKESSVPVGTVPVYQVMVEKKHIARISKEDILNTIRIHGEQGVDFITVHCGFTRDCIPLLKNRITGVVSRGGTFIMRWMQYHGRENPLFEYYDEVMDIAKEYDMTLSLGDGLRPGCIADATDKAQIKELKNLGILAERARNRGVQAMIEGPGHIPLNQIEKNIKLQKKYCKNAPFYVLGPLVTDIAPGYDHITCAIGGTLAAYYGASFLCYVTPAEHLSLPTEADVKEGVIATKIAAHAADVARGHKKALDWDRRMSVSRKKLDWEGMIALSIDPEKAREYRKHSRIGKDEECTMCGEFCVMKDWQRDKA